MMRLIHRYIFRHAQDWRKVTPLLFDPFARGYLVKCACGKEWAL